MTASKFPQFVRCPRSVLEQPDDVVNRGQTPKNPAALRGTKIHSVIDTYIKHGLQAAQKKSRELDIHSDFRLIDFNHIGQMARKDLTVFSQLSMAGNMFGTFRAIDSYSDLKENDVIAGTADCIVWDSQFRILRVIDWKTGLDRVDAENNEQLMVLAYMFMKAFDVHPVCIDLWISCPVTGVNDDLYVSEWITTQRNIISFVESCIVNMTNPIESSGPHCRYCRFKQNCKSFKEMSDEAIKELDVLEDV